MQEERSLEQIYRSAVNGLYSRLRSNYDYLYRKFGNEGLVMIEEMGREYGLSIADRAGRALKDRSIEEVAGYLTRIFETVAYGLKSNSTLKENDGRIILKVTQCPLRFDNTAMCRAHTTMEKTVVEKLNPRLQYSIGKSIPAGDAYCEHIIEENEEASRNAD
jgi:hypothetical protein